MIVWSHEIGFNSVNGRCVRKSQKWKDQFAFTSQCVVSAGRILVMLWQLAELAFTTGSHSFRLPNCWGVGFCFFFIYFPPSTHSLSQSSPWEMLTAVDSRRVWPLRYHACPARCSAEQNWLAAYRVGRKEGRIDRPRGTLLGEIENDSVAL